MMLMTLKHTFTHFITQKELINEKKIEKIFWIKNFVITFRIV
jgi:hypothetical protein